MSTLGTYSLSAAVLVSALTLLVSLAAVRFESSGLRRAARGGIILLALLLSLASVALARAMVQSDFSLSYVIRYTEKALPVGYKLAAFWAGQEGSLLLWGWLLAVMGVGFVLWHRKESGPEHAVAVGSLAIAIGFFAALMLFAANPFQTVDVVPADGRGLNPMLQDPGMIWHPPILFVGYAGYTMPFVLLIGTLVARPSSGNWITQARPWAIISWIFLGAGIVLGAEWAYTELGWGGYWAWDPVENASLLPWLTGTALLHSIIAQKQQGMFKRWTASLVAMTFILCIFGTWITRSGVVDSVHTFGKSLVGTFFGVFLMICTVLTVVLVAVRWRHLRSERPLGGMMTREGAILGGNVLLVGMMLITMLFTMFPAITKSLAEQSLTVSPAYYNKVVLPLGLGVVALMAVAPLLSYGSAGAARLGRSLGLPLVLAALTLVVLLATGIRSTWALASAALGVVALGSVVVDWTVAIWTRQREHGENPILAALRQVAGNHRRYAAHVVHMAVVMMVIGIAGSSLYGTKHTFQLKPGQSVAVEGYNLTLDSLREQRYGNYTAVEAAITMTNRRGETQALLPQRRFYDKHEDASSEVALRSSWREDFYLTLAGWDDGGHVTTLQVFINPLVSWIWAGGIVMTLGAILCLLPKYRPQAATVAEAVRATHAGKSAGKRVRMAVGAAN